MIADAKYGVVLFALLLLVGYFLARRMQDALRRVAADIWAALAALAAVALGQPINHAVGRARPFAPPHHVHILIHHALDYGFPSDHATAAGAVHVGIAGRLPQQPWAGRPAEQPPHPQPPRRCNDRRVALAEVVTDVQHHPTAGRDVDPVEELRELVLHLRDGWSCSAVA